MTTHLYKRILVGVDGSPSSLAALRESVALGELVGADVEAVTAWERSLLLEGFGPADYPDPAEDARRQLDRLVDDTFPGGKPARLVVGTLEGPPARALVKASEEVDLLVLGSRGLGGFAGLLLGSVSSTCVIHARCSVLIIRDHSATAEEGENV